MPGWTTNDMPLVGTFNGSEQLPIDTEAASGASPLSGAITLQQLAVNALFLNDYLAAGKTLVAGSRYYSSWTISASAANNAGVVTLSAPRLITGIAVRIGATGGTDNWLVEMHDANGVLVATSATAGVLVGTAATWQKIAFTTAYAALPGVYFLVVQTNGTTATLATYNAPSVPAGTLITGSATGTLGTAANFTPATTYTANLGPVCIPYT